MTVSRGHGPSGDGPPDEVADSGVPDTDVQADPEPGTVGGRDAGVPADSPADSAPEATAGAPSPAGSAPEVTADADPPAAPGGDAPAGDDEAPRSARILVAVLFVLMLVPGVIGFDAWPLTGWRLFSLSRDADQTRWVLQAIDTEGERRIVSLEELPLRYRHAEWPMAELPGASDDRRDAVCTALLAPVVDVHPGTVELVLARDHAELVERDGEWSTTHDVEPFHACTTDGARPGEAP